MFTATDILVIIGIVLLSASIGLMFALVVWYLAILIRNEIVEFVDVYKGERRKCLDEDDYLFSEWVKSFHAEPFNTMREHADAN